MDSGTHNFMTLMVHVTNKVGGCYTMSNGFPTIIRIVVVEYNVCTNSHQLIDEQDLNL